MDEPFVSLDQPTAENLYEVLVNYWKKKTNHHNFNNSCIKGSHFIG